MRRTIVFFGPSPLDIGGAGKRVGLLTQGLLDEQIRVVSLLKRDSGVLPRIRVNRNHLSIDLPGFDSRFASRAIYLSCAIFVGVLSAPFSCALISLQFASSAMAAAVTKRASGKRWIALSSTSGRLSEADEIRSRGGLRERLFSLADCIVAQNEESRAEFTRLFPKTECHVVPNPVQIAKSKNDHPTKVSTFLYVGRFSEEKGIDLLLQAWKALSGQIDQAQLTIVGDAGRFRPISIDEWMNHLDEDTRGSIFKFPWQESLEPFWTSNHAFVLASRSEGMSNSLLEAISHGLVVIASDIPANRAVLGDDYPGLFRDGDSDHLAEVILGIVFSQELTSQCLAAAETKIKNHELPIVTAQLLKLATSPV